PGYPPPGYPPPYGYPPPMYPMGPPLPTSPLAVWSLITGILACPLFPLIWFMAVLTFDRPGNEGSLFFLIATWLPAIAALITGILMLAQQRKNPRSGGGMAITGIVLGALGLLGALTVTLLVLAKA